MRIPCPWCGPRDVAEFTYGEDGGIFAEHPPTPSHLPGIEAATGSLGHGMPMGLGMALSARIQKENYNVVALLSGMAWL